MAAKPNLQKIEQDALFYAAMSCLPAVKEAYRYFHAQGKTEEDFDRCAAEALTKAVRNAVQITAREVSDPVWPYALDDEASGETMAQREEVCAAWADLPAALTAHPAMKRLYRALGGIRPRGVMEPPATVEVEVVDLGSGMQRLDFKDANWWHKLPPGRYTLGVDLPVGAKRNG